MTDDSQELILSSRMGITDEPVAVDGLLEAQFLRYLESLELSRPDSRSVRRAFFRLRLYTVDIHQPLEVPEDILSVLLRKFLCRLHQSFLHLLLSVFKNYNLETDHSQEGAGP